MNKHSLLSSIAHLLRSAELSEGEMRVWLLSAAGSLLGEAGLAKQGEECLILACAPRWPEREESLRVFVEVELLRLQHGLAESEYGC